MQTLEISMDEIHRQLKKLEEIQNFLQTIPGLKKKQEPVEAPAIKIHCYWQQNNQEVA